MRHLRAMIRTYLERSPLFGWWWSPDEDLAPPIARASFVGVVVLFAALAVGSNVRVSRSVAAHLGAGVYWIAVLGAATCSYAASTCLSRSRYSRASRLLAGTLVLTTVYQLAVICTYEQRSGLWQTIAYFSWPAIPFALAFWARAAFGIPPQLRRGRVDPRSGWARIAKASRQSARPRIRFASVNMPLAELGGVWIPATAFSVAGLVPDFVYTSSNTPSAEPWNGWGFAPHWPYIVFCVWTGLVLLAAALSVEAAWRCRAPELIPGVLVRARSARTATKFGLLVITLVFTAIWTGDWPAPIASLPIAVLLLFYALHTVDADSYRAAAQAFSSIRRRSVWAVAWISISVVVATAGRDPFMRGGLAVTFALLLPLAPTALRAVDGIPQEVAESTHRFGMLRPHPAEALAAFLAGAAPPPEISTLSREAIALARDLLIDLTDAEFHDLVTGLPLRDNGSTGGRDNNPINQVRLRRFVGQFAPLDAKEGFDSRLVRFVHLVYETIQGDEGIHAPLERECDIDGFSKLWVLTSYLKRYISTAKTVDEREQEDRQVKAYRVWLRRRPNGGSDGRPIYTKANSDGGEPIDDMTLEQLEEALRTLTGRDTYDAAKKFRDRSLDKTLDAVRTAWLRRLGSLDAQRSIARKRRGRRRGVKPLDETLVNQIGRELDEKR